MAVKLAAVVVVVVVACNTKPRDWLGERPRNELLVSINQSIRYALFLFVATKRHLHTMLALEETLHVLLKMKINVACSEKYQYLCREAVECRR